MSTFPVLMHTALDATDCRELAEFYRQFLGLRYRPGDEPPADGSVDDAGWLVLVDESGWAPVLHPGVRRIAFTFPFPGCSLRSACAISWAV